MVGNDCAKCVMTLFVSFTQDIKMRLLQLCTLARATQTRFCTQKKSTINLVKAETLAYAETYVSFIKDFFLIHQLKHK